MAEARADERIGKPCVTRGAASAGRCRPADMLMGAHFIQLLSRAH